MIFSRSFSLSRESNVTSEGVVGINILVLYRSSVQSGVLDGAQSRIDKLRKTLVALPRYVQLACFFRLEPNANHARDGIKAGLLQSFADELRQLRQ